MADITGYPYGQLPGGWENDVLKSVAAPNTPGNTHFLDSWERFEQGRDAATAATYNPFNTTEGGPGTTTVYSKLDSTSTIWNYKDWQSGLNATINTLFGNKSTEYGYSDIVSQLRSGNIQKGQDVKSKGFVSWGGYSDINTSNYNYLPSTDFPTCTVLGQISGQCAPKDNAVATGGPADTNSGGSPDTPSAASISTWIIVGAIILALIFVLK